MKNHVTALAALTIICNMISGFSSPADINRLWKDYETAQKADQPRKQLEILSKIKTQALSEDKLYDFHRAGELYIDVSGRINWKTRGEESEKFDREVTGTGSAVLNFYHGPQSLNYALEHRAELEGGCHSDLHEHSAHLYRQKYARAIVPADDFEYALWALKALDLLTEKCGNEYPKTAFIEYSREDVDLAAFVRRYEGKAAALLAEEDMIMQAFRDLDKSVFSSSAEYQSLRKRCEDFERRRKSFKGSEKTIADCCTQIESLIKTMDAKSLDFNIKDGHLVVHAVNIPEIDVTISRDRKVIASKKIANQARSYHVPDTLRWDIPDMDDGDYTIRCSYGKTACENQYSRHAISIAVKCDTRGTAIFAADAISGKPLGNATLEIASRNGKTEKSLDAISFAKGFSYIPEATMKALGSDVWKYNVRCTYRDAKGLLRSSEYISLNKYTPSKATSIMSAILLKDRAAFHPGEEVQFKAIAFMRGAEFRTVGKNTRLRAVLRDPEYKEIDAIDLTANEFGTATGAFKLQAQRNGRFTILLYHGKQQLASTSMVVDEFVLPTFDLKFDPDDRIYLPGDEVTVSGRIASYSGHSLNSAKIRCTIRSNGTTQIQDIIPETDGHFSVSYASDPKEDYQYVNFNIAVTDATGETLDWDRSFSLQRSIWLSLNPIEPAEGSCSSAEYIFGNDNVRFTAEVSSGRSQNVRRNGLAVNWQLCRDGSTILSGTAEPGDEISLDLAGRPSGLYTMTACATMTAIDGQEVRSDRRITFLMLRDGDSAIEAEAGNVFKRIDGDDIAVQFGNAVSPVWAIIELYGSGNRPLISEIRQFHGLSLLQYSFRKDWPETVQLKVLYFLNGDRHEFSHLYDNRAKAAALPLEFTRFQDRTVPGGSYSFLIHSEPGVECAAAIFDKSSEAMASNFWNSVTNWNTGVPDIYYNIICGRNETSWHTAMYRTRGLAKSMNTMRLETDDAVLMDRIEEVEEEIVAMEAAPLMAGGATEEPRLREDFSTTIAFEPFLRTDSKGEAELKFTNRDKLSTYVVSLFAHTRDMRNAVLRREMTVTIPVKIATVEPQFLYAGDCWQLRATLSSNAESDVRGTFKIEYSGTVHSQPVTVPAGGEMLCSHDMQFDNCGTADIKISFIPDESGAAGDAILIHIPVLKASQTLTESHSALFKAGMSRDDVISALRSQFVNFDGQQAVIREISILDMLRETVPSQIKTPDDTPDAIVLSRSIYSRLLCSELGVAIDAAAMREDVNKLLECVCSDGGFAWIAGMESSPVITATVLYRLASARKRGHELDPAIVTAMRSAAAYLDRQMFSSTRPYWRGGISTDQYLYVRSLVPEAVFSPGNADSKTLKNISKFLTPSRDRGMQGEILAKARRLAILDNLSDSKAGLALADAWGIKSAARLRTSAAKDLESLTQYAVEHQSGGMYFPNAVMPFRGLLESEAHAHALLCDLMDRHGHHEIAEGVRLWLMVQKESQKWSGDPGFIEALASVMRGSEATLATSVIALTCSGELSFESITESGNGMTISRRYFRLVDGARQELVPGDTLNLGERILAEYSVHNDENRSFVRLSAGHPTCLRPAEQLSGYYRGSYRVVRATGSEFLYEVFPEEDVTVSEEFFVTQAGTFISPAITIESIYAPHYRANDRGGSGMTSK